MKLYHGSSVENLTITTNGKNLGYDFGAVFFTRSYRTAHDYGNHVYSIDFNAEYFDGEAGEETDTALLAVMAERGIAEEHFDICYHAVIREDLTYEEGDDWADLLNMDWDDASWEAQAMRIEVARRLGFTACGMNDECGSIAVLPEYCGNLVPATDPDDEEEE